MDKNIYLIPPEHLSGKSPHQMIELIFEQLKTGGANATVKAQETAKQFRFENGVGPVAGPNKKHRDPRL